MTRRPVATATKRHGVSAAIRGVARQALPPTEAPEVIRRMSAPRHGARGVTRGSAGGVLWRAIALGTKHTAAPNLLLALPISGAGMRDELATGRGIASSMIVVSANGTVMSALGTEHAA
jgi:hypothetical protein